MLYDRFREACEKRGTTITQVLRDIGRAEGNTGSWKAGKSPKLDIVMEMAEHLNMTLDDFVYGDNPPIAKPSTQNSELSDMEQELLEVFSHIPADRQQLCLDFLRTHMVQPEKYADKMNAKSLWTMPDTGVLINRNNFRKDGVLCQKLTIS